MKVPVEKASTKPLHGVVAATRRAGLNVRGD
jgi:hypothetical protein